MKTKRILLVLLLFLSAFALVLLGVVFLTPSVRIEKGDLPRPYRNRLYHIFPITLDYHLTLLSSSDYLLLPSAMEKQDHAIVWGNQEDCDLLVKEESLWAFALSQTKELNAAILYPENSKEAELAESLVKSNPRLLPVGYQDRITDANIDRIRETLAKASCSIILLPDPLSAYALLGRSDGYTFYLDWRDGSALQGIRGYSIEPCWEQALGCYLSTGSSCPFDYRLRPLKH